MFGAVALLATPFAASQPVTDEFNTPGTYTFTVPAGVTEIIVETWGGGGHGGPTRGNGNKKAGGGGGGAYARSVLTVSPGQTYTLTVGSGSDNDNPGGDSYFGSPVLVLAKGGESVLENEEVGATGGQAVDSIGDVRFSGGDGGNAGGSFGGGGGSSAGTAGSGEDGSLYWGGSAPTDGGDGGNGGIQGWVQDGRPGDQPGGGGGGAASFFTGPGGGSAAAAGGRGGDGLVRIRYTPSPTALILEYQMEQSSWDGTAGEVEDSSGNGNDGTSVGDADTEIDEPAIPGSPGTCRYATFEASGDFRDGGYIQSPGLSSTLNDTATMTFWIRTTQESDNSEAWQSPGIAGIEDNGGTDDIFWGWIDQNGHIGISVGNDFSADQKSTIRIADGTWRHVALTWDRASGDTEIYIDGVLDRTGNTGTGNVIGNSFSSIGRIENTSGGTAPYYFDGELDELRVYEGVLSAGQIDAIEDATRPCETGPDHIRLIHSGATGVTCLTEAVTVQACADAACSSFYDETIEVTLGASGDGVFDVNPVSVTEQAVARLRNPTASTTNIWASADDAGTTQCFIGGNQVTQAECSVSFENVGIVVDGDFPGTMHNNTIVTQIAGKPSGTGFNARDIRIRTVKDDGTGVCEAAVQGKTLDVSISYGVPVPSEGLTDNLINVAGENLSAADTWVDVPLTFDGSGTAAFTFASRDAGRYNLAAEMDIPVTDETGEPDPPQYTVTASTTSNDFVVRPLAVFGDATGNPRAADADGNVFTSAGDQFNVDFTNLAWTSSRDGDNDGQWDSCESPPASVAGSFTRVPAWNLEQPAHELLSPADGMTGTLSYTDSVEFPTAATQTSAESSYSEVGIIQLDPDGLPEFLGADVKACTPNIGRFIPHHFKLSESESENQIIDRAALGCSSDFTYIGERFDAEFTILALNADGNRTQNYEGDFAFLYPDVPASAGVGELPMEEVDGPGLEVLDIRIENWIMGSGVALAELKADRNDTEFDKPFGPFDFASGEEYAVAAAPVDADSVALLSPPETVAATNLYFGRVVIDNAIGSELAPLDLPWRAEYWDGDTWLLNEEDSCTAMSLAVDVDLRDYDGNITDGTKSVPVNEDGDETEIDSAGSVLTLASGQGHFRLTSPGFPGFIDLILSASGNWSFLRDDLNDDDDYQDNPQARASFGLFDGNSQRIYIREIAPQ